MTPEDLIGPAAAKALAEHFDLTPKAKPLPEVVTMEEAKDYGMSREFQDDFGWRGWSLYSDNDKRVLRAALSSFVLRWLRARLDALPKPKYLADDFAETSTRDWKDRTTLHRADTFKALTGREWTP